MSDLPPRDPLIGSQLGSFQIERQLGAGGMSAVYLARQERPRRLVALKALRPMLAPGPDQWPLFLARFRREADAMAALDHANITPIYEFGEEGNLAYLVMPYLPDGSLADLLAREGPLPVEQVVAAVRQVAAALDYAHQHGIIHRDVKPSNVLIHPDGRLLLSDFGIARPLDKRDLPGTGHEGAGADGALTMAGAALGTPDFMAPEQVVGDPVSPETDVYALGALAYTLLAGHTPFGGRSTQETLARQLREPPQPLRLDRPDIPSRVEEALFWALAKDPAQRPHSAGALAQALQAGLRGGPFAGGAALWRRAAAPGASLAAFASRDDQYTGQAGGPYTPPAPSLGGPGSPNAPTMYDPQFHGQPSSRGGGAPAWPVATAQGARRGPTLSPALVAAIGLALVVLLAMAVTLGSVIGANNPLSALIGQGLAPHPTATLTPLPTSTPSPSPSPTATPPGNWLSARPTSITLGCSGAKRTQYVRLTNLGDSKVSWTENTQTFMSGIKVSPNSGDLDAGHSVTISIYNTLPFINQSGEIDFIPTGDNAGDAGDPVAVTFTANC